MNDIEDFLRRLAKEKLGDMVSDDDDEIIDAELVEDGEQDGGVMYVAEAVPEEASPDRVASVFADSGLLSSTIESRDDRMDRHVHQVFDHQLGQLGKFGSQTDPGVPPQEVKPKAAGWAELLRSPATLRDAIILSEIIRRPEERW